MSGERLRIWAAFSCANAIFWGASVASAQTAHEHHGLYLRGAAGLSYFSDSVESDPFPPFGTTATGTIGGSALTLDLAVGGSLSPGFVVGGALYFYHLPSASTSDGEFRAGGVTVSAPRIDFDSTSLTVIGPFVDYYFGPRSGAHIGGAIGYGIFSLGSGAESGTGIVRVQSQTGGGIAFVLNGGYEWWVSSSWGIGVLGQLAVGLGSGDDNTGTAWRHRVLIPGVLVSATMN